MLHTVPAVETRDGVLSGGEMPLGKRQKAIVVCRTGFTGR